LSAEWWQVPASRADLERALSDLNALAISPPEGDTAFFCDLCEGLIGLLDTGARCAVTAEEELAIGELRGRLDRRLEATVYVDRRAIETLETLEARILGALLGEPRHKLAIYGTLAPGEVHHAQIADVEGRYTDGFVRGDLRHTGWGAEHGFPVLTWRPDGPRVPVQVFRSSELERHWQRLDEFEGEGYCRILVPVEEDERGVVDVAHLYADKPVVTTG